MNCSILGYSTFAVNADWNYLTKGALKQKVTPCQYLLNDQNAMSNRKETFFKDHVSTFLCSVQYMSFFVVV